MIVGALLDKECCSQAKEGMWGMPGHTEAMKAVVSCEKLGGVAHTRWSRDGRMGEPGWWRHEAYLCGEKRTQGTDTSQYLEEEKSTEMSGVAASETDPSPNR